MKRTPRGKTKPLAYEVFAEKAKERQKEIKKHVTELNNGGFRGRERARNYQLGFISAMVGGRIGRTFYWTERG